MEGKDEMGISRIRINLLNNEGRVIQKVLLGSDGHPSLKAGDSIDVAFENPDVPYFQLFWRKMTVVSINNGPFVTVTDDKGSIYWDVDVSRIRRPE